jgi:hypothetical protein
MPDSAWYAVRCVFKMMEGSGTYEERVTLWVATSAEEAIDKAEAEAIEYSEGLGQYLGFAQSFRMDGGPADGSEVFSLMRDSDLDPNQYVTRFFGTGAERARDYGE